MMHVGNIFSTMGEVQYHRGYHDKCGGYLEYRGRYHDYCGDYVEYRGRYHEYHGGVQYRGDTILCIFSTMGDIMIHVGDIMIHVGDIMMWGCSVPWGYSNNKRFSSHGTEHPTVLMISPTFIMVSPRYSR